MPDELPRQVDRAVAIMRQLESFDETSTDFVRPAPWGDAGVTHLRRQLHQIESNINRLVARAYKLDDHQRAADPIPPPDRIDAARRWINWCLGICLGRWPIEKTQWPWAMLRPLDSSLAREIQVLLAEHAGEESARQIASEVGGLERFFARDFSGWHNRLYRGRPVFWCFSSGGKIAAISFLAAQSPDMREMFAGLGIPLRPDWKLSDAGIAASLAPLAACIADLGLASSLENQSRMRRRMRSCSATASTPGC